MHLKILRSTEDTKRCWEILLERLRSSDRRNIMIVINGSSSREEFQYIVRLIVRHGLKNLKVSPNRHMIGFAKENIIMSVHALSRIPRLNKPGLPEVSEKMLMKIINGTPNYTEGEDKQIYFIQELQLLVVRNKETKDIISVVRRKEPKEVWKNV